MKRTVTVVFVCVLLTVLFAGCGKKAASAATSGPALSGLPPGTLPVTQEKVDLRIFFQQESQVLDYVDNKFTKHLEEQTNVHINWELVSSQDKTQKLNLLLATGQDLPDVFMGGMDTSILVAYAAQGTFIPLEDYIDKTSLWFKNVIAKHPELPKMMTAPDGHIYALPNLAFVYPNMISSRMWINRVWLDKLGLKAPTTTDEYRDVLRAFKTRDPNGNGRADEIPLIGATNGWNTIPETFILNSFLEYPTTGNGTGSIRYTVSPQGKITPVFNQEAYRDGIIYMNELVKEGLLDTVTFTQDINQLRQGFENPGYAYIGSLPGGGANSFADRVNSTRYQDYELLPPLKGPKGVQSTAYNPYLYFSIPNCYVITSSCKNPEVAFRFADYFYDEQISLWSRLGKPGEDYTPNPPKAALDGGTALYEQILVWGSQHKAHWQNTQPLYNFFDAKSALNPDPYYLTNILWNAMLAYQPYAPKQETCLPPLIYTADEAKEMNDINVALIQYIDESRIRFITTGGIEREWASYLRELDNIGLKRVVEIVQTAYDRFANAK
ncbi:ABC transporter substrate-binding protein [Spirochaetia bacterium]|nr:ABC transporter substrate-binding protein [Spirochaetia bacterium]